MTLFPCLILVLLSCENSHGEKLFVRLSEVLVRGTSSNTLTVLNIAQSEECIDELKNLHSFTTVQYTTELTLTEGNRSQTLSSRVNIWCSYRVGQEQGALGTTQATNNTQLESDTEPIDKNQTEIKAYNKAMLGINNGNRTRGNKNITSGSSLVAALGSNQAIVGERPKKIKSKNKLRNTDQIILAFSNSKQATSPKDRQAIETRPLILTGQVDQILREHNQVTTDFDVKYSEKFDQTVHKPDLSDHELHETNQITDNVGNTHFVQLDQTVYESEPSIQIPHENNQIINFDYTNYGQFDEMTFALESSDQTFRETNQIVADPADSDLQGISSDVCASQNMIGCKEAETSAPNFGCCAITNDSTVSDTFGDWGLRNIINVQPFSANFVANQSPIKTSPVVTTVGPKPSISNQRMIDESKDSKTIRNTTFTAENEGTTPVLIENIEGKINNTTYQAQNETKSDDPNSTYVNLRLTGSSGGETSGNTTSKTKNDTKSVQNQANQNSNYTYTKLTDSADDSASKTRNETKLVPNTNQNSNHTNPRLAGSSSIETARNTTSNADNEAKSEPKQVDLNSKQTNPRPADSATNSTPGAKNEGKTNPNSNYTNPRLADTSNKGTASNATSKSKNETDGGDKTEFDIQFIEKDTMGLNPRFFYILLVDVAGDALEKHLRMLWKKYKTYKFIVLPKSTPDLVYYFSPYPECDIGGKLKAVRAEEIKTLPRTIERSVWNLHKCKMGVVIYSRVPTAIPVDENNQFNDTDGANFIGQDGMFMNTLIERMNFTPVRFTPRNVRMEYGIKRVKGKLTGTFLPILNGSAEICSNGHFVKDYRDRRVDFVTPITLDYVSILAPKASVIPPVITVLLSFEPGVWIMIALTFFVTVFVYTWYLKYAVPKQTTHFFWSSRGKSVESSSGLDIPMVVFDTFRFFISSPPPKSLMTNSNFERILIASVLTFAIVITSSFQGNLVRFLSAPVHYPDIETLKQLEESPLLIKTSSLSWRDIFYSDPMLSGLASKVDRWKSVQDMHDSDGNFAGFQRINVHSYKYFKDVILTGLKNNATRTLHTLSQNLITYYLAYIVIKDSPYRNRIDSLISQMDQAGLVTKWSSDVIKYTLETYRTVEERRSKEKKVFTVEDLSAAFIVLATGVFIGSVTLLLEVSVQYYHHTYKLRKVIIAKKGSHPSSDEMFSLGSRNVRRDLPTKTEFEFCL